MPNQEILIHQALVYLVFSGIAGLFNGCKAHHVSARSAESIKTFPNNSRKQPSLTRPLRLIDFMRLLKELI